MEPSAKDAFVYPDGDQDAASCRSCFHQLWL